MNVDRRPLSKAAMMRRRIFAVLAVAVGIALAVAADGWEFAMILVCAVVAVITLAVFC